jgi:hypothetical protein
MPLYRRKARGLSYPSRQSLICQRHLNPNRIVFAAGLCQQSGRSHGIASGDNLSFVVRQCDPTTWRSVFQDRAKVAGSEGFSRCRLFLRHGTLPLLELLSCRPLIQF